MINHNVEIYSESSDSQESN